MTRTASFLLLASAITALVGCQSDPEGELHGQDVEDKSVCEGNSSWTDTSDLSVSEQQLAEPAGVLVFEFQDGSEGTCSGSLIGTSTFITAGKCVDAMNSQAWCDDATVAFGFLRAADGSHDLSSADTYDCDSVTQVRQDETLGYAIIELDGSPGDSWGSYGVTSALPAEGEQLTIVQHVENEPRVIAYGPSLAAHQSELAYRVDTGSGSFGAPVLNAHGQLVAIQSGEGCAPSAQDSLSHNFGFLAHDALVDAGLR